MASWPERLIWIQELCHIMLWSSQGSSFWIQLAESQLHKKYVMFFWSAAVCLFTTYLQPPVPRHWSIDELHMKCLPTPHLFPIDNHTAFPVKQSTSHIFYSTSYINDTVLPTLQHNMIISVHTIVQTQVHIYKNILQTVFSNIPSTQTPSRRSSCPTLVKAHSDLKRPDLSNMT